MLYRELLSVNESGESKVMTYSGSTSEGQIDSYIINLSASDADLGHRNEADGCYEENPGEGDACDLT